MESSTVPLQTSKSRSINNWTCPYMPPRWNLTLIHILMQAVLHVLNTIQATSHRLLRNSWRRKTLTQALGSLKKPLVWERGLLSSLSDCQCWACEIVTTLPLLADKAGAQREAGAADGTACQKHSCPLWLHRRQH